jgi:polyhydroxybutyrate depolymerase
VVIATLLLVFVASSLLTNSSSLPADAARGAAATPRAPLLGVVDAPRASTGCGKSPSVTPGHTAARTITSGGTVRAYLVHLPLGYSRALQYPLVLNFHGHGNTAAHQEQSTGFSVLANHMHFIVAYPQGIIGPDLRTGWASGGPNKPRSDDVLFVSDLITSLQRAFCVNPGRIYATGFSNGGGMTSVLACRLAGRIAAFASVSGSYFIPDGGCFPDRPVPFLEFHGTGDGTVPYDGNPITGLIGAMQWVRAWAVRDDCADETTTRLFSSATEFDWTGCQGGAEVIQYRIADGVHDWPGNALFAGHLLLGDTSLDASALIWSFFAMHPLPTPGRLA